MNEIEKEIDKCVLYLMEDDWTAASQGLVGIVDWLSGYVKDKLDRQESVNNESQMLFDLLPAITKAIEKQDCIQLADLLGYDLKTELKRD